jgi:hypothetical protein
VAVIFSLLTTVFAMSGDGNNEPAKQTQEVKQDAQVENAEHLEQAEDKSYEEKKIEKFILQNVWPDQKKSAELSEEEYNQIRFDYFEKAREHGVTHKQVINEFWENRINVNVLDELEELGANPGIKDAEKLSIYDKALFSQIVVIGKVLDRTRDNRKRAFCPYSHRVKVDEVLSGEGLIDEFDEIRVEMDHIMEPLFVNQTYCLFLTRYTLEARARYNDGMRKEPNQRGLHAIRPLPEYVNEPNVFTPILYSSILLENLKPESKDRIKKIGELNDKANFYNRSYK